MSVVVQFLPQLFTMSLPNKALCITGPGSIEVLDWPLDIPFANGNPVIEKGQVLVRVKASGICGSDVSNPSSLAKADALLHRDGSLSLEAKTRCKTDQDADSPQIHFLNHLPKGYTRPFVIGHESAGEIVQSHAESQQWKIGDRVAIKPGASCSTYVSLWTVARCPKGVHQDSQRSTDTDSEQM